MKQLLTDIGASLVFLVLLLAFVVTLLSRDWVLALMIVTALIITIKYL